MKFTKKTVFAAALAGMMVLTGCGTEKQNTAKDETTEKQENTAGVYFPLRLTAVDDETDHSGRKRNHHTKM